MPRASAEKPRDSASEDALADGVSRRLPALGAVSISACLICKDEMENLARTFSQTLALFDEVVVVDTGSSDETVAFIESHGVSVQRLSDWNGDFSLARNAAIARASSDWIFSLDADEYLQTEDMIQIRQYLSQTEGDWAQVWLHDCPVGTFSPSETYFRLRLFRNHRGIHFVRPFNEQVVDAAGNYLHSPASPAYLRLFHWGNMRHLTADKRAKKVARNLSALLPLLESFPNDPAYLFQYAMTKMNEEPQDLNAISSILQQALPCAEESDLKRLIAYKLAVVLFMQQRYPELLALCEGRYQVQPMHVEMATRYAQSLAIAGRPDAALPIIEAVLAQSSFDVPPFVYPCEYQDEPFVVLGIVWIALNEKEAALSAFSTAVALNPESRACNWLTRWFPETTNAAH